MQTVMYPVVGNEKALPFYLTGIGTSAPEYRVKRDSGLVSHQILLTLSGRGTLSVDGKSFAQKEGSVFYLTPGLAHEYYPDGGDWTTAWIVFRGERLPETMSQLGFPLYAVKDGTDIKPLRQLFDRILAAAHDPVTGGERCSVLIYDYILAVRQALFSENSASGGLSEKAVKYIETHYAQDIEAAELAALCGVTVQHFCRVFKAQTGMRPMEYLAHRRIAAAKNLLCGTEESIEKIAQQTGFSSLTYFGMVFRKYEGITPGDYRRTGGVLI